MFRFLETSEGRILQYASGTDFLGETIWTEIPVVKEKPIVISITYDQFYKCLNSEGLDPNTNGGIAVDIRAAWNILRRIVNDSTTEA